MISRGTGRPDDQPLYDRLWGSGFLPSRHQGVKFRSVGDPVLYLSNPPGIDADTRRRMLDDLGELNQLKLAEYRRSGNRHAHRAVRAGLSHADIGARTDRCVAASRTTCSTCTAPTRARPGTFAANCLLARRLAERGVRFIQLFHMGWDQHTTLPTQIRGQCSDTDQPSAALIDDLKQRGLLDDTLVVWGGEFGRTVYCQGNFTATNYGRDHHPRCFTDVAGRRRHPPRHDLRRDRRLQLQHRRRTRCTSTT